jgi:hypothetical protein
MAEPMTEQVSERVSSFARYNVFQERCYYFFLQMADQDTAPGVMQWTFHSAFGSYGAFLIVAADASVVQGLEGINPWSPQTANDGLSDGALFAAVNAQWDKIIEATGVVPPEPPA